MGAATEILVSEKSSIYSPKLEEVAWELFRSVDIYNVLLKINLEKGAFTEITNEGIKPYLRKLWEDGVISIGLEVYGGDLVDHLGRDAEQKTFGEIYSVMPGYRGRVGARRLRDYLQDYHDDWSDGNIEPAFGEGVDGITLAIGSDQLEVDPAKLEEVAWALFSGYKKEAVSAEHLAAELNDSSPVTTVEGVDLEPYQKLWEDGIISIGLEVGEFEEKARRVYQLRSTYRMLLGEGKRNLKRYLKRYREEKENPEMRRTDVDVVQLPRKFYTILIQPG